MDEFQARQPGRCYVVGGAVRDALMGHEPGDLDWVVVGSSPQAMQAAGFKPVGRDFPVFLHPVTGEEYALARTERKSAPGYHGFAFHAAPDVTLEQDLARRDLTINAMARGEDGTLIDPYGGARDLQARIMRHVSPAFAEDPVRLLRVARFAARWPEFTVAAETMALMRQLVNDGEVDALVPERVWQELSRGLMEARPSRMLQVLAACDALPRLLPGVQKTGVLEQVLDVAAGSDCPLPVRYALLAPGDEAMAERLKVPTDARELAMLLGRESAALPRAAAQGPEQTVLLLERCDAFRRPERFADLLRAGHCLASVGDTPAVAAWPPAQALGSALSRARTVDTAAVAAAAAARGARGPEIGRFIHEARVNAVASR